MQNEIINKYYFTLTLRIFLNYGKAVFQNYKTTECKFKIKDVKITNTFKMCSQKWFLQVVKMQLINWFKMSKICIEE